MFGCQSRWGISHLIIRSDNSGCCEDACGQSNELGYDAGLSSSGVGACARKPMALIYPTQGEGMQCRRVGGCDERQMDPNEQECSNECQVAHRIRFGPVASAEWGEEGQLDG